MMSQVHIVGIKGNMGCRYQAILKFLGVACTGHDKDRDLSHPVTKELVTKADGFIICTPTEKHLDDIEEYLQFDKPILCEKPLTKIASKLEKFLEKIASKQELVTMVNQYQYMPLIKPPTNFDETYYNYFKTGPDGLPYDCLNIIGLAHRDCIIKNSSPIWKCFINGVQLNLSDMDNAYVEMIKLWTKNPQGNMSYALEAHKKVEALI